MSQQLFENAARLAALWWARYLPGVDPLSEIVGEICTATEQDAAFFGIEGDAAAYLRAHYYRPNFGGKVNYQEKDKPVTFEQFNKFVEVLTREILASYLDKTSDYSEGGYVILDGDRSDPEQVGKALQAAGLESVVPAGMVSLLSSRTLMFVFDKGHLHAYDGVTGDQNIIVLNDAPDFFDFSRADLSGGVEFTAHMAPFIREPVPRGTAYWSVEPGFQLVGKNIAGAGAITRKTAEEHGFVIAHFEDFDGTVEQFLRFGDCLAMPQENCRRFSRTYFAGQVEGFYNRRTLDFIPGEVTREEMSPNVFAWNTPRLAAVALDREYAFGFAETAFFTKKGDVLIYDSETDQTMVVTSENGQSFFKGATFHLFENGEPVESSSLNAGEFFEMVRRSVPGKPAVVIQSGVEVTKIGL